ncbi:hypothetical protein Q73_00935 [Bacillus coahuilensis m2-6]|uniref:hypothetical protein n=1 Tax=Bacillus coahuilensis TaxID=408580 RepID=UPI0001850DFA|nr:hypothetical protein [Bacillus coahuilensis]KUP09836.1 hypothetical protein Q73_00935 [Bacillus coahuilensis m2-6]
MVYYTVITLGFLIVIGLFTWVFIFLLQEALDTRSAKYVDPPWEPIKLQEGLAQGPNIYTDEEETEEPRKET